MHKTHPFHPHLPTHADYQTLSFIIPQTKQISNPVQAPSITIFLALSNIWPLVDSQVCCGNAAANQVSRTNRILTSAPPAGPDHRAAGSTTKSSVEASDGDAVEARRGEMCERTSADSAG